MSIAKKFKPYSSEFNFLSEKLKEKKLIIWIGAGISVEAGLPYWSEFVGELNRKLKLKTTFDPMRITQLYARQYGRLALEKLISKLLNISSYKITSVHRKIADIYSIHKDGYLISTNYDRLIEKAFNDIEIQPEIFFYDKDLMYDPTNKVKLYKPNGCISRPSTMVLTQGDYIDYKKDHPNFSNILNKFNHYAFLLTGCDLSDHGFLKYHEVITSQLDEERWSVYVLLVNPSEESKEYFDFLNIKIIALKNHDEIAEFLNDLKNITEESSTIKPSPVTTIITQYDILEKQISEKDDRISHLHDTLGRDLEAKLDQIDEIINHGDYLKAKKKIDSIILDLSTHYKPLSNKLKSAIYHSAANTYSLLEKNKKAIEFTEKALDSDPSNNRAKVLMTKFLALKGKQKEAVDILDKIDIVQSFNMKLAILLDQKDLKFCGELIKRKMPSNPNSSTFSLLAQYYQLIRNFKLAKNYIQKALKKGRSVQNLVIAGLVYLDEATYRFKSITATPFPQLIDERIYAPSNKEKGCLVQAKKYLKEAEKKAIEFYKRKDKKIIQIKSFQISCLSLLDEAEALNLAEEVLEQSPCDLTAANYLLVKNKLKNIDEVINEFRKSDLIKNSNILFLSILYIKNNQPDLAYKLLSDKEELFVKEKIEFEWYGLTSVSLRVMKKNKEALDLIEGYSGNELEKSRLLFDHFYEIEEYQRAESIGIKIYQTEKSYIDLFRLCEVLKKQKKWDKYIQFAAELANMFPNIHSYSKLLDAHYSSKNFQGVVDSIKEARSRGIKHKNFDKWEGLNYLFLGDFKEALYFLEKAYKQFKRDSTEDSVLSYNLAVCYLNLGREEQGLKILDDLVQSPNSIPETFIMLSQHFQAKREFSKSFHYMNMAKERFPDNEEILASFIRICFETGNDKEANEVLKSFPRKFPESKLIQMKHGIDELKDYIISARKGVSFVYEKYKEGKFPIHFLPRTTNIPLALEWYNRVDSNSQRDDYPKFPIYSVFGESDNAFEWMKENNPNKLVLDYTALLTLFKLNVFHLLPRAFEEIYISNLFFQFVNVERHNLATYQPTRYQREKEIFQYIAEGKIEIERFDDYDKLEKLESDYMASQIGPNAARNFFLAKKHNSYYLDEYLPEARKISKGMESLRVRLKEIIYVLSHKGYITERKREELFKYIAKSPFERAKFEDLLKTEMIIVDLSSLETIADFDLLGPFLKVFKPKLSDRETDDLKQRIYAVERKTVVSDFLEKINLEIKKWPKIIHSVGIVPSERTVDFGRIRHDIEGEIDLNLSLLSESYNLSQKYNVPLVMDDRAGRRVIIDKFTNIRFGSLELIKYLYYQKGLLNFDEYKEKYLEIIKWNYLFIPLDSDLIFKLLKVSIHKESSELKLLRQYYSSAIYDSGLSRIPKRRGLFDCEAVRFYRQHNILVTRLLVLIWNDPDLDNKSKEKLSNWVKENLWKDTSFIKRIFPERGDIIRLDAMQKNNLLIQLFSEIDGNNFAQFSNWFYKCWLQEEFDSEPRFLEEFQEVFSSYLHQFFDAKNHKLFKTLVGTIQKFFPNELFSKLINYQPVLKLIEETGGKIDKLIDIPEMQIPRKNIQKWFFDVLERIWLRKESMPLSISYRDMELGLDIADRQSNTLFPGLKIKVDKDIWAVPIEIRDALFHSNREIRKIVFNQLVKQVTTKTKNILMRNKKDLLAEEKQRWEASAQNIHESLEGDWLYFQQQLLQKIHKQIPLEVEDLFPESPQPFFNNSGFQNQDFVDSSNFTDKFIGRMKEDVQALLKEDSFLLDEKKVENFISDYFVYPFAGSYSPPQYFYERLEWNPRRVQQISEIIFKQIDNSYNPIKIENCLDLLLTLAEKEPLSMASLKDNIINKIYFLLDYISIERNEVAEKKRAFFNTYIDLIKMAYGRMQSLLAYKEFSSSHTKSFYALMYSGDIIEIIGKIFAQSPEWALSQRKFDEFITERIIEIDKSNLILKPLFKASKDVLNPSSINITRVVLLGTIQILNRHTLFLSSIYDENLENLIFSIKSIIEDSKWIDLTELFKPFENFDNFFNSYLNQNLCKALSSFLTKIYGDAIEFLSDKHLQFYRFIKDLDFEKEVNRAIQNLIQKRDEKVVNSLAILISYFKENVDPKWSKSLKNIQNLLSPSKEIEKENLIHLMMHLNYVLYLNCQEAKLRLGFKDNLLKYYYWLYKSKEKTVLQVSYVEMVCSEEGGVGAFANWIDGLLDQRLNEDVLKILLNGLKESRKYIKFEERVLFDNLIEKINAKI